MSHTPECEYVTPWPVQSGVQCEEETTEYGHVQGVYYVMYTQEKYLRVCLLVGQSQSDFSYRGYV